MDSRLNDQDIWASVRRLGLDRRIKHYSILQQILLVGEGDFSFSLALANAFGSADNIVASSLDSREKITSSYEAGQNNLHNLEKLGAMILHGVNARKMNKHEIIRERRFDRIVFNFPHAGFFGNEKDSEVIKKHRKLLKMFFKNGMTTLNKNGEIHVTHQEQDPYDKWKVVEEAENCGLLLKESVEFDRADYPGYTNRRGAGSRIGETFFLGECKTYMFILRCNDEIHSVLPKISLQGHLEILKAAILELETERQNRRAAKTAKANLESSFNDLRTVADKALKETNEFRRMKDRALGKKAKITKQKEKISKQLVEALRLKEEAAIQRNVSALELESERKARIDAESEKTNLEVLIHELRIVIGETLKNVPFNELITDVDATFKELITDVDATFNELITDVNAKFKERDEFKRQRDEALREKDNIAKQSAEALRLKEDALKQRDVSIRKLEFERKASIDTESAKDKILKERDEFRSKKDEFLREKEIIAKQLGEALRLKEDTAMQSDAIFQKLGIERKARIYAESARDEILKERDEFRSKKDEVLREKVNIAEQLAEALRFKEDVVKERAEELQSSKKFLLVLVFLCIFIYFYYHPEKLV